MQPYFQNYLIKIRIENIRVENLYLKYPQAQRNKPHIVNWGDDDDILNEQYAKSFISLY